VIAKNIGQKKFHLPLFLAGGEDFRNVEPELSYVIDLRGTSLSGMALQVKTRLI
jgi:hypothetical protein